MAILRCREGCFSRGYVPVVSHVTDIPQRLKEISQSLFVMLNIHAQRFEIHDSEQAFSTLACVLPFEELDARTLDYVRERHMSRQAQIIAEIERHNERLEQSAYKSHMDRANIRMTEALKYLNRHEGITQIPEELMRNDAG